MQLGVIGLGRMGADIVRRLTRDGHTCVVYDRDPAPGKALGARPRPPGGRRARRHGQGARRAAHSMDHVAGRRADRSDHRGAAAAAFAAATASSTAATASGATTSGAASRSPPTASHYHGCRGQRRRLGARARLLPDDRRPARDRRAGSIRSSRRLRRASATIPRTPGREGRDPSVEQGYLYTGPCGAGHFVKMVHNGVEYGLMQAYAEGFDILRNADSPSVDRRSPLHPRSRRHRRSVAARQRGFFLVARPDRERAGARRRSSKSYSGYVEDSGEGRWTVWAAIDESVPAEVLSAALYARFRSRQSHTFAEKIISAMRKGFGGHLEPKKQG